MTSEAPGTQLLQLGTAFAPTPTADWEAAIARDLKGSDYEKRLVWRPEADLAVRPYFRREDLDAIGVHAATAPGEFPFVRGGTASWDVLEGWNPTPDTVRADLWHDAGGTSVQEVGLAVAAGVDHLAALTDKGTDPEDAAAHLFFAFAVGSTFFLEVAKLRAARLLWAQACGAFGIRPDGAMMRIDVRTARANKSRYDPYTNLLRVTTEALSAVIGGCERLFIEPFGFDRHLATNVHHVLREEAHLSAVIDAGGGAYYLEALTDAVAREGWALFQTIEHEGGFRAATQAGTIERMLAQSRAAKAAGVALRRRTLVGVNNYPNLMEHDAIGEPPALPGTDDEWRMAHPFESIRGRTAAYVSRTGKRPVVALLRAGDPRMAGARANFALNFFGCAGFDIADVTGLADTAADLVVLCTADPDYLALARDGIPRTGAPVIVAASPPDRDALVEAGVQGFVHLGSNAVDTLTEWQDRLGIQ